jgi:hypothetical protein
LPLGSCPQNLRKSQYLGAEANSLFLAQIKSHKYVKPKTAIGKTEHKWKNGYIKSADSKRLLFIKVE